MLAFIKSVKLQYIREKLDFPVQTIVTRYKAFKNVKSCIQIKKLYYYYLLEVNRIKVSFQSGRLFAKITAETKIGFIL